MSAMPRVSVVVAAHNVARYLPGCVESLLGQTEESLELLLVDDGSTDETSTLVDYFSSEDPRVSAMHRLNGGVSAARNSGLLAAKGEYVCFIDGDDWVDPNMIESMVSWCERMTSPVSIAGAWVDFHDRDDQLIRSERRVLPHHKIRRGVPVPSDLVDDGVVNLLGYVWNKVYRRDWLMDTGVQFEEGLNLFEDIDFNAKVLAAADCVTLVPEAFVHYVQRPRSSLGTTRGAAFLAQRLRAIDSMDTLLEAWGVDRARRTEQASRASGVALWTVLRSADDGRRPKDRLRRMVEQPGVERLIARARTMPSGGWRGFWAATTLMRHRYGLAMLPLRVSRVVATLRNAMSRRSNT